MEISAPRDEKVKDILRCWEPFHRGASAADRLNSLYPTMYRVPAAARGMGLQEDYSVPVPTVDPQFFPSTIAFILWVSHSPIVLI